MKLHFIILFLLSVHAGLVSDCLSLMGIKFEQKNNVHWKKQVVHLYTENAESKKPVCYYCPSHLWALVACCNGFRQVFFEEGVWPTRAPKVKCLWGTVTSCVGITKECAVPLNPLHRGAGTFWGSGLVFYWFLTSFLVALLQGPGGQLQVRGTTKLGYPDTKGKEGVAPVF